MHGSRNNAILYLVSDFFNVNTAEISDCVPIYSAMNCLITQLCASLLYLQTKTLHCQPDYYVSMDYKCLVKFELLYLRQCATQ